MATKLLAIGQELRPILGVSKSMSISGPDGVREAPLRRTQALRSDLRKNREAHRYAVRCKFHGGE